MSKEDPVGPASSDAFWRELSPDQDLPHPERIGPFSIEGVIGEGGFGLVYLGRQERPRREVAVKVLRPGLSNAEALKRFELESHVLARFHHPGIAQVLEVGQADLGFGAQPYCAMEYIRGQPLMLWAQRHSPDTKQRVKLLIQLCEAVQHAHQKGVLHRDLSPGNVLVDQSGRARVVDFGVARLTQPGDAPVRLHTVAGQVLGTLPYSSPEQLRGRTAEVDTRTDVYALGALSYELLTGRTPHVVAGLGVADAVRTIEQQEPPLAGRIVRALKGDLETIVAKALAKEPERRYSTAAEMAADFTRWIRDEPVAARPASGLYQLGKLVRRHRGLVTGLGFAVAAVTLGLLGTIAGLARAWRAESAVARRAESADRELGFLMEYTLGEIVPRIGSTDIQGPLLEELRERLEAQRREDPSSAKLRSRLARVLEAQGMLEVQLDHHALALQHQEQALALREGLAREAPEDLPVHRGLSVSYAKVGDLACGAGRLEEGLSWYERALALDERLAAAHPGEARVHDDLCWSLERVALLEKRLENSSRQAELLLRRHEIALGLQTWDPEPLKARFNLAASHAQLGLLALQEEDFVRAAGHAKEQVRLLEELLEARPEDWHYLRYLANAYGRMAKSVELLGDHPEAERHHRKAALVSRRLAEAHPSDADLVQEAAYFNATMLADFLFGAGRAEEGRQVLQETLDLGRSLADRAPGHIAPLRLQLHAFRALEISGASEASSDVVRDLYTRLTSHPRAEFEDHLQHGTYLLRCGDAPGAARVLETLRSLSDSPPPATLELCTRVLLAMGDLEEAQKVLSSYKEHPLSDDAVSESLEQRLAVCSEERSREPAAIRTKGDR